MSDHQSSSGNIHHMDVWRQIRDLDDLRSIGSFRDVKEKLSNDLEIRVTSKSWNDLLQKIRKLQNIFGDRESKRYPPPGNHEENLAETENIVELPYFKSETDRAIFCLIETNGRCRQELLGVMPTHYGDRDLAKSWMKNLAKLVHPDKTKHPKAQQAMSALDSMYHEMLGE